MNVLILTGGYLLCDWGFSLLLQIFIENRFGKIRFRLIRKIMTNSRSLSMATGDLWLSVSQTIFHLNDLIAHKCVWVGKRCLLGVLAIIACALISLRMTILYMILLPPLAWLLQRISRKSQVLQKQTLEEKSEMAEWIRQSCRAMETIQAFQMEPIMMEQMEQKNESVRKLAVSSDRYRIRLTLVKYVASIGSLVVVLLAGKGESMETLVIFSVLSVYIQSGLEMLDHIFYTYRLCRADIESLKELERSL